MEKKQRIKVSRTKEGTLFEVAFFVLGIIVWALIIWMISKTPDVIATHFDASGRPNGYGSPWGLLVPCLITTVVGAGLLVVAYFPHLINMPVEMKTIRQYELAIRSTRIAALILLLMTLAIPATLLVFDNPSPWPVLSTVGLLLLDVIVFCILIHKARI